jgi:hydrogenase maturation protein HypF
VDDAIAGVPAAAISARFHETLARAAAMLVRETASDGELGCLPLVLTGGCFANARLAERVLANAAGRRVFLHRRVPPGDGGLALGQAFAAGARLRKGDI